MDENGYQAYFENNDVCCRRRKKAEEPCFPCLPDEAKVIEDYATEKG